MGHNSKMKRKDVTVKVRMRGDEKRKLQRFAEVQLLSVSDIVRISVAKHMEASK